MQLPQVPKLSYENVYMNNILHDTDGTLTGTGHETFVAGRIATPALLHPGVCTRLPQAENGAACDAQHVSVRRLRLGIDGWAGDDQFMEVRRVDPPRSHVTVSVSHLAGADYGVCVAPPLANHSDDASYFMQRGIADCGERATDGYRGGAPYSFLPMVGGRNRYMTPRPLQSVVVGVSPTEAAVGTPTTFTFEPPSDAFCHSVGHPLGLRQTGAPVLQDGSRVAFVPRFQMVETTGQTNAGAAGLSLEDTNRVECAGAAESAMAGIVSGGQVTVTLGTEGAMARAQGSSFEPGDGGEYVFPIAASKAGGATSQVRASRRRSRVGLSWVKYRRHATVHTVTLTTSDPMPG